MAGISQGPPPTLSFLDSKDFPVYCVSAGFVIVCCVYVHPPVVCTDLVTLPQPADRFHYLGRRQREGYSSVEEVGELSDSHSVRPRMPDPVPISPGLPSSRDYVRRQ